MLPRMPGLTYIFRRGVTRGVVSAVRDPGWVSSVGSLFGVLFVSQIFLLLALGVQAGLSLLQEQTDIRLEILETANEQQVIDLTVQLQSQPYVEEVTYITKQQAYERQKQRDPELIAFLDRFQIENPFPETLGVRLRRLDDYQSFVTFLRQPAFASIVNPNFLSQTTDQEDQVERLMAATIVARSFLLTAIGIIAFVLLFVLIELVRRRAVLRSQEIFVQQLVGATPLAILLPFGIEVLILLLLALVLAFIFTVALLFILPLVIPGLSEGGLFSPWVSQLKFLLFYYGPWVLLLQILILPILSFLGAWFGLWHRLRTPTLSAFA